MILTLAKFISYILHPILILVAIVFLNTYQATQNIERSLMFAIIASIFAAVISGFVLIGVKRKVFTDFDISKRKQRVIIFPFAAAIVFFYFLLLVAFQAPQTLLVATALFLFGLLLFDVVNKRIKASVHLAVLASFVMGISFYFKGSFFLSFLLIPLLAWSRIAQKRHSVREVVVGTGIGIGLSFIAILIIELVR